MKRDETKGKSQVGYKRPPVESRFKKGQSGNPHGRRRPPTTVAAMLALELKSTVGISENGRLLKVSKMRLLINEAVKQAMNGNFNPLNLITKISHSLEQLSSKATGKNPATLEEDEFSNLSDDELKETIIQRFREQFPEVELRVKKASPQRPPIKRVMAPRPRLCLPTRSSGKAPRALLRHERNGS
jgi:hypothetical protein